MVAFDLSVDFRRRQSCWHWFSLCCWRHPCRRIMCLRVPAISWQGSSADLDTGAQLNTSVLHTFPPLIFALQRWGCHCLYSYMAQDLLRIEFRKDTSSISIASSKEWTSNTKETVILQPCLCPSIMRPFNSLVKRWLSTRLFPHSCDQNRCLRLCEMLIKEGQACSKKCCCDTALLTWTCTSCCLITSY